MNSTLDLLLSDFSKDAEFTVQPFDSRFEAVVTVYATEDKDQRKYRAVDSNARVALSTALMLAQEAWS
jgi:hypothetical protein